MSDQRSVSPYRAFWVDKWYSLFYFLLRIQYRVWNCIALTCFSTTVSDFILGSRPNNSTPARLSALHCVVGRLALCLCLYFTETVSCFKQWLKSLLLMLLNSISYTINMADLCAHRYRSWPGVKGVNDAKSSVQNGAQRPVCAAQWHSTARLA